MFPRGYRSLTLCYSKTFNPSAIWIVASHFCKYQNPRTLVGLRKTDEVESWMIAAPMSFATVLVLMREPILEYIKSFLVRRSILRSRKNRRDRSKKRR